MSQIFRAPSRLRTLVTAGGAVAALTLAAGAARADSVVMALSAAMETFDPQFSTVVGSDLSVISHIYSPLVIRNPDGSITGDLAESWEAVDDLTWRFTLRPGITFPNGEPMDAEAVRWNFERLLDPDTPMRQANWYRQVTGIEVVSPTEFILTTSEPFPSLINQLTILFMLAPEWTQNHDLSSEAMGTGPYELVSYAPRERVVLRARPDYHGPAPAFEEVTIRMLPEAAVRVSALLAGEVDFILDVPPTDVDRINASGVADADWVTGNRTMMLRFNNLIPPMQDNRALRQAISHAIDRQLIVDAVLDGRADVSTCQLATPLYFGHNPDLQEYAYDPDRARELLAESGLPQPVTIDIDVPLGRYLLSSEIGQIIAAQLAEVGIQANINEMEYATWSSGYTQGIMAPAVYMGQAWPSLDVDGLMSLYSPTLPSAFWVNEEFGALIAEGRSTVDPERRQEIYNQASAVMCEEAPVAFLFTQPVIYATSGDVTWNARSDDWVRAYDLIPQAQ